MRRKHLGDQALLNRPNQHRIGFHHKPVGRIEMSFTAKSKFELVADERLYLDREMTRVLKDGHPDSCFLLAAEGTVVPHHLVTILGLKEGFKPEPVPTVGDSPAEDREDRSVSTKRLSRK